jgi:hypothetical protein
MCPQLIACHLKKYAQVPARKHSLLRQWKSQILMGFFQPIRRSVAMMRTANCKPLCRSWISVWAWRRDIQVFSPIHSILLRSILLAFLLGPCYFAVSIRQSDLDFPFTVTISLYSPHRAFFVKPQFSAQINETSVSELTYTRIRRHPPLITQATSVNNLTCFNKLRICFIKHFISRKRG